MKKLIALAAVAACGAALAVESANIVGYTTIDAPAAGNYKALSVAFDNVGSVKTYPIASLITCDAPKGAASALTSADQIWLWDTAAGDWVKYFYLKKGTQPAVGWCKKGETAVTTDTISSGETFFFYRGTGGAATTLTLSGEVKAFDAQPEYDAPAAGNYKFIGYPWPVAMPIGGFEKYQGAPKGAASALTSADQIWLWDTAAGDWVKYFYLKKGTQAAVGWCTKGETAVTTDSVPAGQGFFFYRGTGGAADKITFTYDAN